MISKWEVDSITHRRWIYICRTFFLLLSMRSCWSILIVITINVTLSLGITYFIIKWLLQKIAGRNRGSVFSCGFRSKHVFPSHLLEWWLLLNLVGTDNLVEKHLAIFRFRRPHLSHYSLQYVGTIYCVLINYLCVKYLLIHICWSHCPSDDRPLLELKACFFNRRVTLLFVSYLACAGFLVISPCILVPVRFFLFVFVFALLLRHWLVLCYLVLGGSPQFLNLDL